MIKKKMPGTLTLPQGSVAGQVLSFGWCLCRCSSAPCVHCRVASWKFSSATKHPKQQQFRGFRGAHGPGWTGLAATAWVPMGAPVPVLSPHDPPNPSQGWMHHARAVLMCNTTRSATRTNPMCPCSSLVLYHHQNCHPFKSCCRVSLGPPRPSTTHIPRPSPFPSTPAPTSPLPPMTYLMHAQARAKSGRCLSDVPPPGPWSGRLGVRGWHPRGRGDVQRHMGPCDPPNPQPSVVRVWGMNRSLMSPFYAGP